MALPRTSSRSGLPVRRGARTEGPRGKRPRAMTRRRMSPWRDQIGAVVLSLAASAIAAAGGHGQTSEWPSIHGSLTNQRYADVAQVNLKTISRLGAAWISQPFAEDATSRMTPLMHD